jgi:uncharacterized protein
MTRIPPQLVVGTYYKLGSKTFWLTLAERVSASVALLVIGSILAITLRIGIVPEEVKGLIALAVIVFFILFFVSLIAVTFATWLTYTHHTFALDDDAIRIRKGIFTKIETSLPYRQIQNVEVERRFLFQLLGLSKLVIITAGHDNPNTLRNESEGVLPAIDKYIAMALQDELVRRSDVQRVIRTTS